MAECKSSRVSRCNGLQRCTGKTKAGRPCKNFAIRGRKRCQCHTRSRVVNALTFRDMVSHDYRTAYEKYMRDQKEYQNTVIKGVKSVQFQTLVQEYVKGGFSKFILPIRTGNRPLTDKSKALQRFILNSPETPKLFVLRGFNLTMDHPLYKTLQKKPVEKDLTLMKFGFQSVTTTPLVALQYAKGAMVQQEYRQKRGNKFVIFHILVPPGSKMLFVRDNPDEFVLPSGTVFRQLSPLVSSKDAKEDPWWRKISDHFFPSPVTDDKRGFAKGSKLVEKMKPTDFPDWAFKDKVDGDLEHVFVAIVKQEKGKLRQLPSLMNTKRLSNKPLAA